MTRRLTRFTPLTVLMALGLLGGVVNLVWDFSIQRRESSNDVIAGNIEWARPVSGPRESAPCALIGVTLSLWRHLVGERQRDDARREAAYRQSMPSRLGRDW